MLNISAAASRIADVVSNHVVVAAAVAVVLAVVVLAAVVLAAVVQMEPEPSDRDIVVDIDECIPEQHVRRKNIAHYWIYRIAPNFCGLKFL